MRDPVEIEFWAWLSSFAFLYGNKRLLERCDLNLYQNSDMRERRITTSVWNHVVESVINRHTHFQMNLKLIMTGAKVRYEGLFVTVYQHRSHAKLCLKCIISLWKVFCVWITSRNLCGRVISSALSENITWGCTRNVKHQRLETYESFWKFNNTLI